MAQNTPNCSLRPLNHPVHKMAMKDFSEILIGLEIVKAHIRIPVYVRILGPLERYHYETKKAKFG